jgi:hypothetical protein
MPFRPALFTCLVLFVAGCASGSVAGSAGKSATPEMSLAAARARTAAVPTGEFTTTIAAPGFQHISPGAFDAPRHRYRFQPDPSNEIRQIDDRLYVRSGPVAQRLGVPTEWMTGHTDDPQAAYKADDPLAYMDLLGGATGPVVDAGHGEFRLSVSPSAALAAATPAARDRLHAALAADLASTSLLDHELAVLARVSDSGFLDEIVIDAAGEVTITVVFDHLGEAVTIDPPSPSQVTDVGVMLGR